MMGRLATQQLRYRYSCGLCLKCCDYRYLRNQTDTWSDTHMPDGVSLVWVKLEVVVSNFQRWPSEQPQVGPATNELGDCLECVQRKTVVAVVGHVSHKHRNLDTPMHTQTHLHREIKTHLQMQRHTGTHMYVQTQTRRHKHRVRCIQSDTETEQS